MNKIRSLLACIALTGLVSGCALFNNWQDTAGKLLASTALTVDASMQGWAKWVAQGHATASQEAQVKSAYQKYQLAMTTATAAYSAAVASKDKSLWEQASSVLTASSSSLTGLIQSFTKP